MGLLQRRQNPNLTITNNFFDSQTSFDWLIVGLGNPGKQYDFTRHNIGFMAIDNFILNNEFGPLVLKKDLQAQVSSCYIVNKKILAVKPQTFMNQSGKSLQKITQFYKISSQQIVIIYDDFDLPFGSIRTRFGGSSGGHKGIESIIKELNLENFNRIRIGINNNLAKKADSLVLKKFNQSEKEKLDLIFNEANVLINELIFGNNNQITAQTINVFSK